MTFDTQVHIEEVADHYLDTVESVPVDDDINHHFNIATHNGAITVSNRNTGGHRTFRIRTQPADSSFAPGERIVSLLTGSDNWTQFGFVKSDGQIILWKRFRSRTFEKYAGILENPTLWGERGCEYLYEGSCRVCNRPLTNPESIRSGIGPVCANR